MKPTSLVQWITSIVILTYMDRRITVTIMVKRLLAMHVCYTASQLATTVYGRLWENSILGPLEVTNISPSSWMVSNLFSGRLAFFSTVIMRGGGGSSPGHATLPALNVLGTSNLLITSQIFTPFTANSSNRAFQLVELYIRRWVCWFWNKERMERIQLAVPFHHGLILILLWTQLGFVTLNGESEHLIQSVRIRIAPQYFTLHPIFMQSLVLSQLQLQCLWFSPTHKLHH